MIIFNSFYLYITTLKECGKAPDLYSVCENIFSPYVTSFSNFYIKLYMLVACKKFQLNFLINTTRYEINCSLI